MSANIMLSTPFAGPALFDEFCETRRDGLIKMVLLKQALLPMVNELMASQGASIVSMF